MSPVRLRRLVALVERRPLVAVFLLALTVRVAVVAGLSIANHGFVFPDERQYHGLANFVADGRWSELDPYGKFLYERTGALTAPLTAISWLLGPDRVPAQLWVALVGAGAAPLTARIAMEVVGRRRAIGAGLVVALLPSEVLWSSLILKDSTVWLAAATIALLLVMAQREDRRARLAVLGAGVGLCLGVLGYLRLESLVIATYAVAAASFFGPRTARRARVAGALALTVAVPWLFGLGPAGASYLDDFSTLESRRGINAIGSNTALVEPRRLPPSTRDQHVSPHLAPDLPDAKNRGEPVRLSESSFPRGKSGLLGNVAFLPKGVANVILKPYPWAGLGSAEPGGTERGAAGGSSIGGFSTVRLARLEHLLWYPLLALALLGLLNRDLIRRRATALVFPVLYGGATLIMYAETEGNLGTAYRHRGELVWVAALLAAIGAARLHRRLAERRGLRAAGPRL